MSANRSNIHWHLDNMIGGPAASSTIKTIFKTEDGILLAYGTSATNVAPLTTAALWSPGCLYIKIVDSASVLYLNTGTKASPSWTDQK